MTEDEALDAVRRAALDALCASFMGSGKSESTCETVVEAVNSKLDAIFGPPGTCSYGVEVTAEPEARRVNVTFKLPRPITVVATVKFE